MDDYFSISRARSEQSGSVCEFFSENITVSPFLLSSCVAFLKLPLKSMTLPRKLYSLVYFSISRARSEQSGSVCDTLSLEDKFCYEKIHNKFCKYILGLKKIACNISARSHFEVREE
jgi:hypothetical protein